MSHIQRILIATKYRFIGDTLLAVPAIRAASQLWPDAHITLLTGSKGLEMVRNAPFIHDTIEFDPYRKSDEGLRRFFSVIADIRRRRFDLALVMNRSFHSVLISTWGGCKSRVAWEKFSYRDFMLSASCPYSPDDNEIDSYLDIVACAYNSLSSDSKPLPEFDRELALWVTDEERALVPSSMREGYEYVGMQPGASHDYKRWPAPHMASVASSLLSESPNRRLVLIGGPDEREAAGEMMAACDETVQGKTIDLTGTLSLRGTVAALEPLSLFVGNDTAIRHAATALGVPSVALFGPTSAVKWGNALPPSRQVIVSETGRVESIPVDPVLQAARTAIATA